MGDAAVAEVRSDVPLASLTTLRLGGPADTVLAVDDTDELVETVRRLDAEGIPMLLVGGGSNLVVSDDGFAGTVVLVRTRGTTVEHDASASAVVTVAAGEPWDPFVAHAVDSGWVGLEALSGIPGLVGASPVQNVGAYGQDVSQTIASVRTYDRHEHRIRTFRAAECGFSYRHSRFKATPDRYVVLSATFLLRPGDRSTPVRYAELARDLGIAVGERAGSSEVRDAVLRLRRAKAMVLDEDDHDTWSAGSFFTNPVLDADEAARLPDGAPAFVQADGRVKTSAAWLIDHAGFTKGYRSGPVRLSTKHALALTNTGDARTADLLALARALRDGVADAYGIELEPEPVLVGCRL